ncbi:MAG TPA: DsrE family protein [Bryobacteraceae bacterium]|jgi:uncharacterized protein involved in oxidation of intracellular sulfur
MDYLFVINDAPYASERAYNAIRFATSLTSNPDRTAKLFFVGEGVWCAVTNHKVPGGQHDIESMLREFLAAGRHAGVCRTCMDARGIATETLIQGAHRSSMDELGAWTAEADKILVF